MDKQPPGVLIGFKGVKYGLQKPATGKTTTQPAKPVNVFGGDSDDEDIGLQVARQAEKKRADAKVKDIYAAALAEDPNVFDYDAVYDSMQQERVAPKQQEKVERKPRYIAALLAKAEERKREQDIVYERLLLKDRKKEDHMYEGKDKFVTAAYRKKLEEDKKWQETQALKDAEEARNDAKAVGHMGNFYKNLLTNNVAYGAGSKAILADSSKPADNEAEKDIEEEKQPAVVPDPKVPLDRYEVLRIEAERQRQQKLLQQGQDDRKDEPEEVDTPSSEKPTGAVAQESKPSEPTNEPKPIAAKRRNDESTVSAARERYLARKRQQTEQG